LIAALACVFAFAGCRGNGIVDVVRPRALRDVPSNTLAFRFEPDVNADELPPALRGDVTEELLATIKADFDTRRREEALIRTVVSPDGQRALALYGTGATQGEEFRIDLYSSAGQFLRNVLPPDLSGNYPATVAWSPDGGRIAFIGFRNTAATTQATPPLASDLPALPDASVSPAPAPSVAPIIAPVQTFSTEQIYTGDRDGFNLRPLTMRDGLVYFHLAWSPEGQAITALACRQDEADARGRENLPLAGRPRIIALDGTERLLDDRLTDAPPVWSPDGAKVATAFFQQNDFLYIVIYDAGGNSPTAARVPLREELLAASVRYDAERLMPAPAAPAANSNGNASRARAGTSAQSNSNMTSAIVVNATPDPSVVPVSFNPIIRLDWQQPETLLAQTCFVRVYANDLVRNFLRWHALHLSPQAAILSRST